MREAWLAPWADIAAAVLVVLLAIVAGRRR